MPAPRLPPEGIEPAITRLQLELKVKRRAAEACLRAGYRSAAEVAAADDVEFHARVALSPAEREEVLARARAPGSSAPSAGERPVLASERRPAGKVLAVAKPMKDRIVRLAGESEPAPRRGAPSAKSEPPKGEAEARKRRRSEADALEAELDERLRGGG